MSLFSSIKGGSNIRKKRASEEDTVPINKADFGKAAEDLLHMSNILRRPSFQSRGPHQKKSIDYLI